MSAVLPGQTPAPPVVPAGQPTIDAIQRDVALANQYRLELIKFLLGVAAALFAFTVAFRPTLERVDMYWAMWWGWLGLALSMYGGIFHMLGWEHYYKSYRDRDWKNKDSTQGKTGGKEARRAINAWRQLAMFFQFGGFMVGVAGIGIFAAANLDNVRKPEEKPAAVRTQPASSVAEPVAEKRSEPAKK
jgi:hypothetical protein